MKTPSDRPYLHDPVLLAAGAVFGSLFVHAALLAGTLLVYSNLSTQPSAPISLALMFGLPCAASLAAFALFSKYARAGIIWRTVVAVLLVACALGQFVLTPFWSCLVSRTFCL